MIENGPGALRHERGFEGWKKSPWCWATSTNRACCSTPASTARTCRRRHPGDDEDNLVGCLLAKNEFKVKRVIARCATRGNRWLYNRSWA